MILNPKVCLKPVFGQTTGCDEHCPAVESQQFHQPLLPEKGPTEIQRHDDDDEDDDEGRSCKQWIQC